MTPVIQKLHILSKSSRFFTSAVLCALLATFLFSCAAEPVQDKNTAVAQQGFSQSFTQDSSTLKLRTSKKEISVAGQLELVLEAAVPENIEVEFPSYAASLGDFTLRDAIYAPPRMAGSGEKVQVIYHVTYLLEPYLSGTYTIPAMNVVLRDKLNTNNTTRVETEPVDVAVRSLLPHGADAAEIKDIKPPLSLPPDRLRQALYAGLGLFLAAMAIVIFFYLKKRSTTLKPEEVLLRPEEIALQELDKLLAEKLLEMGRIKLFHFRISNILRHYIENRFGVKAPERTTEEFLLELSLARSSEDTLLSSHKTLLADFLTQCDLVKFAKHKPTVSESEKTVEICREFIEKTKEND